jgi:hypothetical protein
VSDEFLSGLLEKPNPEFADRLAERLRELDERPRASATRRYAAALAGAAVLAAVALGLTLEPVRAAAREFLDLFRVKRFAAVPVDPARLERLAHGRLDLKSLVGDQVQVVVPPEKPRVVDSPEAGALDAGIPLQQPTQLPAGLELVEASVARPGAFRVQLDTAKLEALAQAAGADEIEIPAYWNGAIVDVELPPVLSLRYARPPEPGASRPPGEGFVLLQSANPQVELPEGVEIATLGRLGLRLAGMSAAEAQGFARAIDWRSTLLVPVPVTGGSYREVEVAGRKGLLVSYQPPPRPSASGAPRPRRQQSLVLWSTVEEAFALMGPGNGMELLELAQSVR